MNLFKSQTKNSVRSTRSQIHLMTSYCFVFDTVVIEIQDVVISVDFYVRQVFNCVYIIMIPF